MYDTALGVCALAWSDAGVRRAGLPERDARIARDRLLRDLPEAVESEPYGHAAEAITGVRRLFAEGRAEALDAVPLDGAALPELPGRVYVLCRAIPAGRTRTYGELARELGGVSLSQAVGHALGRNPFAPIVPCHRVLGADGKLGGFSGPGGGATKLKLLEIERAAAGERVGLFEDLPLAGRS